MKKKLAYTTYLFLLLIGIPVNNNVRAQEDSTNTICFENGYKEYKYGIPFLYLKGTDFEIGLQYGHLLKNELKNMYAMFEDFKQNMMDNEIEYLPWYQRILANLFGGMVFRSKINTYADRFPDDIVEQIRGASEGSDLPESFFREIQVMADLNSERCEGIVIIKGGNTYHCHNLDQPLPLNLISKFPVVVNYDIPGKVKYTNFGFAACLMITTAFNEYGISISENGNNNPKPFDKSNVNLYIEKDKLITQTHNLKEVSSIMDSLSLQMGLILTVASSREKQAVVYDLLGKTKGATPVSSCQFIPNWTICNSLGKKSESIYSGNFHDTSRVVKFAELLDTTKPNMIDEAISILSNTDFYHYTDSITTHIESLHNFETDQSVIFDLADSTVYFTYYPHYAAWNRWLKYNYITRQVSIYKEAAPRLFSPAITMFTKIFTEVELCDWRDSSNVRSLVNLVIESGINNYFSNNFLSTTYLNYYKSPGQAKIYADKLIVKYPDIITGYYNKGRALEAENKFDEAISNYKHALESKIQCDFLTAETNEHLALAYYSIGKKILAAEYANQALVIHNKYWIPEYFNERIQKLENIKASMQ